jgi:arabinogalactan endo-1,4-beta-galactosidase
MQFFHLFSGRGRAANRAFQGMPADFIKGADISTLLDAEKHGAKFYDQNNQRRIRSLF